MRFLELLSRLKKPHLHTPVIVLSGYTEGIETDTLTPTSVVGTFEKDAVEGAEFKHAVRRALAGGQE